MRLWPVSFVGWPSRSAIGLLNDGGYDVQKGMPRLLLIGAISSVLLSGCVGTPVNEGDTCVPVPPMSRKLYNELAAQAPWDSDLADWIDRYSRFLDMYACEPE